MMSGGQKTGLLVLSGVVAAVPFVFGVLRAAQTRTDFRYLWVAIAAGIGAAIVVIGGTRGPDRTRGFTLFAVAFVVSSLAAALLGRVLGATSIPAVLAVAVFFGFCSAAGQTGVALSRRRQP
jgi:FtsH-binding integral membrane protein